VQNTTAETVLEADRPRRSLVLAGGGMRVAYQAGALRALTESGLVFDHVDGASGGTINLAMLLSGQSPAKMCERWRRLDVRDFVSFMPLHDYLRPSSLRAFGSGAGLSDKVFPQLGVDIERINRAKDVVGTFNVCDFGKKQNEVVTNDRIDRDLLVAAVSLPIFMPPVKKNGSLYVDSVWIQDANCMEAVRRGAEEIWVIWCIGNTSAYQAGPFEQYVHMIELSANAALFREFEQIRAINEAVARGEQPGGRTRPIRVHLIKPEYPLPLDPELFAGRITTGTLVDMGYRDAANYLQHAPAEGITLTPEATRMRDPKPGVAFRETMAGPFALDETDPEAGARRGREQGMQFTMQASIEVEDLDRFDHRERQFPRVGQRAARQARGVPAVFSGRRARDHANGLRAGFRGQRARLLLRGPQAGAAGRRVRRVARYHDAVFTPARRARCDRTHRRRRCLDAHAMGADAHAAHDRDAQCAIAQGALASADAVREVLLRSRRGDLCPWTMTPLSSAADSAAR
jgi:predicted acylesterase/phospholipase RssA